MYTRNKNIFHLSRGIAKPSRPVVEWLLAMEPFSCTLITPESPWRPPWVIRCCIIPENNKIGEPGGLRSTSKLVRTYERFHIRICVVVAAKGGRYSKVRSHTYKPCNLRSCSECINYSTCVVSNRQCEIERLRLSLDFAPEFPLHNYRRYCGRGAECYLFLSNIFWVICWLPWASFYFLSPPEGGLDLVTNRQGAI